MTSKDIVPLITGIVIGIVLGLIIVPKKTYGIESISVNGTWTLSDVQLLSTPNDSIECPFSVGDRIELHSNSTFEDANGLSGMWCSNGKWLSLTYFDDGWQAEVMEILSLTNDRLRLRIGVGNGNVRFWLLTYSN